MKKKRFAYDAQQITGRDKIKLWRSNKSRNEQRQLAKINLQKNARNDVV